MLPEDDRQLLFGFFFTHRSAIRLRAFSKLAQTVGFEHVQLIDRGDAPDASGTWMLHIRRIGRRSESRLRSELVGLAREHGVTLDGFDVGNVDGSPLAHVATPA